MQNLKDRLIRQKVNQLIEKSLLTSVHSCPL